MQCILCYYELLRQAQHSFLQTYDVLRFLVKRMQNFLSLSKEQGDVPVTYADTTPLEENFGYKPNTPLREGLRKFAQWYKEFYS